MDPATCPPTYAAHLHKMVRERLNCADPYLQIKAKSNQLAQSVIPAAHKLISESDSPFEAAVRLAIGGNIIDYGVNPNFELHEAEKRIREVFDLPFDRELCAEFRRRLDTAGSIFYMLDNCGEAVIDRLLIERYRDKITVGVRGYPILNDVTRREAALSGIEGVRIVDTGDRAPGVSLRHSGRELLDAMRGADVVVSKGQGNFESLDEGCERPVFFLLRVKCRVVAERVQSPLGSIRLIGRNL